MFRRSPSTEPTPLPNGQPRVFLTSINSITSSSPSKTKWSSRPAPSSPNPTRNVFRRLLWGRSGSESSEGEGDEMIIISDSISGSKRLQKSIAVLANEESEDEVEVHCCKQAEAEKVIRSLLDRANAQIDESNLAGALQHLNSALAMQQKLHGKKDRAVASTLNRIGEVLSNMGEDSRYMAMSAFEESLAIRQESEDLAASGRSAAAEDTKVVMKNLWLLLHESNVGISSSDRDTSTVIQDLDEGSEAIA
ncbi:hypothetical protein ACHAXT_001445 [Thalassiosira profunda]